MARRVVGVAATTAVVAGTAGAIRHHQDQKYANQAAQQQAEQQAQYEDAQQQAQAAPPPAPVAQAAPAPAAGTDLNSQLAQLAQLHDSGALTDQEFSEAKAKVLAGG
jgi:hypothetical protein